MKNTITSKQVQTELILEYTNYAKAISKKVMKYYHLPLKYQSEYEAAALMGLVEAASRFNTKYNVEFKYFSYPRIKGAVIDSVRTNSDLSSGAYRYSKMVQNEAENNPIINAGNVKRIYVQGTLTKRVEYDPLKLNVKNNDNTPEVVIEQKELSKEFCNLISQLPEKQKVIINKYYFEDKTFQQISDESGVMSKSWISRLHKRALQKLKVLYEENNI